VAPQTSDITICALHNFSGNSTVVDDLSKMWVKTGRFPVSYYEKALTLTQQEPERQFLQERIRQLKIKKMG